MDLSFLDVILRTREGSSAFGLPVALSSDKKSTLPESSRPGDATETRTASSGAWSKRGENRPSGSRAAVADTEISVGSGNLSAYGPLGSRKGSHVCLDSESERRFPRCFLGGGRNRAPVCQGGWFLWNTVSFSADAWLEEEDARCGAEELSHEGVGAGVCFVKLSSASVCAARCLLASREMLVISMGRILGKPELCLWLFSVALDS
ncbi:uncharacterized protein LOC142825866 isoform X2 [Pelodiscus sinensis]|uniref:uncharacterized protein LOC142825866 isoform X2 n=1 Tax=Pelodiscus sinensis TaxID=13735 RepID=UPI003F6B7934